MLQNRFHELWSLRIGTALEDRPRYTNSTTFETFPFPASLTPADTAHQRTEEVQGGALIPADLPDQQPEVGAGRMSGAILKSEAYEPPASAPPLPSQHQQSSRASTPSTLRQAQDRPSSGRTGGVSLRDLTIEIANAAKRLNDLRENWLNPPEWTHKVPEVTPLGMSQSPYPDRIEPRPGITETDLKALQQRTLTKLYNQRPAWLAMAHQQLDAAVATAYGWTDYRPDMPDEEILKRLLALNLERSGAPESKDTKK